MNGTLTDIQGIKVGHAQNEAALTGCTVILCEPGGVAGVDVRGAAPGTRETDLLHPVKMMDQVHGILLSGGSAFGLDAAGGVMRYLEERGVGFDVGVARVPIVPGAVLFDLMIGDPAVRPDAAMGYEACRQATTDPVPQGCVGAGTGATVGKLFGPKYATKSGIGSASMKIGGGVRVAALVAVNAFGDVVDPESQAILAGARTPVTGGYANSAKLLMGDLNRIIAGFHTNTTIGVVATDAALTKAEASKVAQMAHNGYARAIRPVHTQYDGDTIFALSHGTKKGDVNAIGFVASLVMEAAILNAVKHAVPAGGLPAGSRQ
ncbi:P1 family peptidase [Anoxynatronum sibiricum]|uniref:P1 family peptidase n=1 Tax=Anoxynatronum sibiricum TaxID=210623 RepID=A0ABU9VWW0_9CLOT